MPSIKYASLEYILKKNLKKNRPVHIEIPINIRYEKSPNGSMVKTYDKKYTGLYEIVRSHLYDNAELFFLINHKSNTRFYMTFDEIRDPNGTTQTWVNLKKIIHGGSYSRNQLYSVGYFKEEDIFVEEIPPSPPTSIDKSRKHNLLGEFRDLVEVAKAEPPGESNYPFSSSDYHKAEKHFEKQKKQQSSFKHRGGRRSGSRTRRQRKSKK